MVREESMQNDFKDASNESSRAQNDFFERIGNLINKSNSDNMVMFEKIILESNRTLAENF